MQLSTPHAKSSGHKTNKIQNFCLRANALQGDGKRNNPGAFKSYTSFLSLLVPLFSKLQPQWPSTLNQEFSNFFLCLEYFLTFCFSLCSINCQFSNTHSSSTLMCSWAGAYSERKLHFPVPFAARRDHVASYQPMVCEEESFGQVPGCAFSPFSWLVCAHWVGNLGLQQGQQSSKLGGAGAPDRAAIPAEVFI